MMYTFKKKNVEEEEKAVLYGVEVDVGNGGYCQTNNSASGCGC